MGRVDQGANRCRRAADHNRGDRRLAGAAVMSKVAKQNILNRDCIKPVKKRRKLGDAECSGFYVSLSPTAPPTFSLKYTCPRTKERLTHRLGIYQAGGDGIEKRDVAYWRVEAMKVKVRIAKGEDIAGTTKRAQQAA